MVRRLLRTLAVSLTLLALSSLIGVRAAVVFDLAYANLPGGGSGDTLLVTVNVSGPEGLPGGLYGAAVRLKYDWRVLAFVDDWGAFLNSISGGVFSPWVGGVLYNVFPQSGRFLFAGGGQTPVFQSGTAFSIRFTYLGDNDFTSHTTWLTIDSTLANELAWTQYPPDTPELLEPPDGGDVDDDDAIFYWSETAGPFGTYTLQFADDEDFTNGVQTIAGIAADSFDAGGLLELGYHYWRVRAHDHLTRSSTYQSNPFVFELRPSTDVGEDGELLPGEFKLYQNYPNPFNPATTIGFYLAQSGEATLGIYNVLGRRVRQVSFGRIPGGEHIYVWDGMDTGGKPAASGVYLYKLETASGTHTKKMMLVR